MKKYRVALAGCGDRGRRHIKAFLDNSDRFEIIALCDINEARIKTTAESFSLDVPIYLDAGLMLAESRPDVFCFATHPDIRLRFIELGVKYAVKGIAFEKPMATSLQEARIITELCRQNGIKAIVSHQQKYLTGMQKIKSLVETGEIGRIERIHVETQAWLAQLGTHFIDYALWISGGKKARWAVGHVHGKEKLSDNHPSPDFLYGLVLLDDDIRVYFECGYLSARHMPVEDFWIDNRLSVYGTQGYAWAQTRGEWAALTRSSGGCPITGEDQRWTRQEIEIQTPYIKDFADWLDDDMCVHSCCVETACHGYEILEAMGRSALQHTRIDLPLSIADEENLFQHMRKTLLDIPTYSAR